MKMNIQHMAMLAFVISLTIYGCQQKPEQVVAEVVTEKVTEPEAENMVSLTREQFETGGMQLGNMQPRTLFETISTTGFLNVPQENQIVISSYLGGYASSTPLLPGSRVQKGQFLMNLTNPEIVTLEQDYLIAKQSLSYLKSVYDRQVTLNKEKISSLDKLLQAESEYKNMLATRAALEQTLLLNNIQPEKVTPENMSPIISLYAPISGVITRVEAVNGRMTSPGETLFEIVNTDHLHLEMKVFEQDVAFVHPGQKVTFTIPDSRAGEYTGEIFLVGKSIDKEERTVTIHAHPDENSDLPQFYGMFVEAQIVIADREADCVPISALASGNGNEYVFVVHSETENQMVFERIQVNVGFTTDTYAEILPSSVAIIKGKQILVKGAYGLMQE